MSQKVRRQAVLEYIKKNGSASWSEIMELVGRRDLYTDTIIQTAIGEGKLRFGADYRYHWQEPKPKRPPLGDEYDMLPEQYYKVRR